MASNTVIQVGLQSQPPSTQQNLRQMIGDVMQWNPEIPVTMAIRFIQNAYRTAIDRRLWYGLMVRGEVQVPSVVTGGTVAVTQGSQTVVGTGTAFTAQMVGLQFRAGFSTGIKTISGVTSATQLTLDIPWGNPTMPASGYSIFQNVFAAPNIKRILEITNQRQGYRLFTDIPQAILNYADTWRTQVGWTFLISPREASSAGLVQWELYPAATYQQVFPYLGYIQPADLKSDGDFPVTMFRSDVLVLSAISDALIFRKDSKYYDPNVSQIFRARFREEVDSMARNDDNLYPKDLMWDFERTPFSQQGALWLQNHAEYY